MTTAYCVVCKKKTEIKGGKVVRMKRGNKAMKGKCSKGHNVYRILGK